MKDGEHLTIGIAGIGRMGAPIARSLAGMFRVLAFDIDPDRKSDVPGICWSATVGELAERSDVFVTVMPGPDELRQCVADALVALRPGALWLDLTSGDPAVTVELSEDARRHRIEARAAPMGGSVKEAESRELVFFVGGPDAAVNRALPVLEMLSGDGGIRRAGVRPEDGQIVKLLANGLWFANAVAAAEAMLIGQGLGLAASELYDLLRGSAGSSRFMDEHLTRLLDGDYLLTFGIDRVVEELGTISAMSRAADVTTPMFDTSARLHRAALERFGPVLGELLAVKMLEDDAGHRIRR